MARKLVLVAALTLVATLPGRAGALTGHVVARGAGARAVALAALGDGERILAWRGAGGVRTAAAPPGGRFGGSSLVGPLDSVLLAGAGDQATLIGARGTRVEAGARAAGTTAFGPLVPVADDDSPIRDLGAAAAATGDVLVSWGTASGHAALLPGGAAPGRAVALSSDGPMAIGGDGEGDFAAAGCHGATWTFAYRPAGGAFASRPALTPPRGDCDEDGETGALAVGPGGAASLVWSAGIYHPGEAGLNVVARPAGGDGSTDRTRFYPDGSLWTAGSGGFVWVSGSRLRYTPVAPGGAIGRTRTLAGHGAFGEAALAQNAAGDTYVAWTRGRTLAGALQRAGTLRLGAAHTLERFRRIPADWAPELAVALDAARHPTLAFTTPGRRLLVTR